MSFPHTRQVTEEDNAIPRTLPDLIAETDKKPIPVKDKVATAVIAAKVFAEANPNIFVYKNLYGEDLVDDLTKFAATITKTLSNFEFHATMAKIFQRGNDFHSVYALPEPLNSTIAGLGFDATVFYDPTDVTKEGEPRRRYVAFDVVESLIPKGSAFGKGSELLTYDGERFDVAVKSAGIKSYGSNTASQIKQGTSLISSRSLIANPVPLEPTVEIGFINPDGTEGTVTLPWIFVQTKDKNVARSVSSQFVPTRSNAGAFSGLSRPPHPPTDIEIQKAPESSVRVPEKGRVPIPVSFLYEEYFAAEVVPTKSGFVGLLRIKSFDADSSVGILSELVRILGQMPNNGLIVDIRDNPGGSPDLTKSIAEIVTGKPVPAVPMAYRATQLVKDTFESLDLTDLPPDLTDEFSAILAAVSTSFLVGEPICGPTSTLLSIDPTSSLPGFYDGPIVTVMNSNSYSAADFYAALQVDERMSLLVGTNDATGGGGASAVAYDDLVDLFPLVYDPLPKTVNFFTSALGRFYRTGRNAGAIVESFGVEPDIRYYPTYNDSMTPDCDLLDFLGEKLAELGTGNGRQTPGPVAEPEFIEESPEPEFIEESPEEIM